MNKKILTKRMLCLALSVLLLLGTLAGCGKKSSDEKPSSEKNSETVSSETIPETTAKKELTPVTLSEVAHSIFYAPQYAAIELGYFEEEGIDLTLINSAGADKVMTALISDGADIGFMGSEASIYVYAEGNSDYAVNFAQLTQRAGNFLVGREADEDFKWEDLKGKNVLGGRAGGMPSHDGTWEHIRGIYEWTSRKAKSGGYGESGKGRAGQDL